MDEGIILGNWVLKPSGNTNWELCRLKHSKDKGDYWASEGRYYQYNTIHLALQYAADQELRRRATRKSMDMREALAEYERITSEMVAALKGEE